MRTPKQIFSFSGFSKVMLTTGFTQSSLNSVEIIDLLSTVTHCPNFPNFPRSTYFANGGLDNNDNTIVCGGKPDTNDCQSFVNGSWVSIQPMTTTRSLCATMKSPFINDSVSLFFTGSAYPLLDSAEIFLNGVWQKWPINLPTKIGYHCMVMLNSTALILIGGTQDAVVYSPRTHIFDIANQKWSDGPVLNFARLAHSCARIPTNSQSSEQKIIVAGGNNGHNMSSVEILDEGSNEWRQGPELPLPICCSVIVEHPLGGIALIGGRTNDVVFLNTIYRLANAGEDTAWELMPQQLQVARHFHTAFLVPNEVADFCEKNN